MGTDATELLCLRTIRVIRAIRGPVMNRASTLRRRIKALTWLVMLGLVISGATAIPLTGELDLLVRATGAADFARATLADAPAWAVWLLKVQTALHEVTTARPFLAYGTDWLAFGHFVIAVAFVGALRDPVRNSWLFTFGMIACALVPPYALAFGAVRGIPVWWRLVDCSFGVFGFIPLWFCKRWAAELERKTAVV
jgi:hypothetical protein